jgi:hypothetical protein
MLHQVDDALLRAPCPVPSCPAYEPNSGSFLPKPINKSLMASRGADIVMQSSGVLVRQSSVIRLPVQVNGDCRLGSARRAHSQYKGFVQPFEEINVL